MLWFTEPPKKALGRYNVYLNNSGKNMDFTKAAKITIEFKTLQDLLAKRTGNPIGNEEIPEILRKAI